MYLSLLSRLAGDVGSEKALIYKGFYVLFQFSGRPKV